MMGSIRPLPRLAVPTAAKPPTPSSGHGMHAHLPNDDAPQVSIVIPARNEAVRLPPSIRQIRSTFPDEPWEFIVVVELSTDGTLEAVREAVEDDPRFVIVANPVARGKGYAVKTGMLRARGEQVFFMDADLSVPLRYIPEFLKHATSADVLIGSRRHPDSIIRLHQPLLREAAGRFFNHALRLLGITRLSDTQCGFKAFSRAAAQAIFSRVQQDGFGFDVEAILIAQTMGLTLLELPVEWADVKGSKVSPLNGLAALRDAILAARRVRRDHS
jgi:glycosyltransferase involved in cell wall biosynthesis